MGVRRRAGGGIIVPALQEHVATKMHEESQIQKERRKFREQKEASKGSVLSLERNKVSMKPVVKS